MPEIKIEHLLMFAGFVLPGAISMYFYGLITPQKEMRLQERLLEAVCFSILNFVVLYVPISIALDPAFQARDWLWSYLLIVLCILMAPVVWPFLLVRFLRLAEAQGLIAVRAKTACDDFFGTDRPGFWVQVVLNDGTLVGGKFGDKSYASSFPEPGHIYIEELWQVDAYGQFESVVDGKPGVLLRPSDYKYLRVFVASTAPSQSVQAGAISDG
jgi:Family of unknown function (DUF6338)